MIFIIPSSTDILWIYELPGFFFKSRSDFRDFPDGPLVKNLPGLDPSSGN